MMGEREGWRDLFSESRGQGTLLTGGAEGGACRQGVHVEWGGLKVKNYELSLKPNAGAPVWR